jgi:hypothetical protein
VPRFDTGSPRQDAQEDFTRERRRRAFERLVRRLRREPSDVDVILPYEEVIAALGFAGQRHVGVQLVPLDSIAGSVDRTVEFDRQFRPTSARTRARWERIALAYRRGEGLPPVELFRIGELHFVRDGHHRISVAKAHGLDRIEADVTEVVTKMGTGREIRLADLPMKGHERLFWERVPLPPDARSQIRIEDPWDYAMLAEGVEAWGFRAAQDRGSHMSREEVALAWFKDEYEPVIATLRECGLIGPRSETEAYMRVVSERYRLMRTHAWSPEIWDRLTRELGG